MITDVPGVRVGHWTDAGGRTGCTVVLLPDGTVGSGEVRGGAPATREFELLRPGRLVERVDAVLLTGGSAFGLAAADGVVRWCEERGVGYPTSGGPVPIVVALGLYDLGTGDPSARPGPDAGYSACLAAGDGPVESGAVGAGTGATVAKLWGSPRQGGVGTASVRDGDLLVGAIVAVNAVGEVLHDGAALPPLPPREPHAGLGSTTIGVVATNARIDKAGCLAVAEGAHDGLARVVDPPHSTYDGDAVVALSVAGATVDARADHVRALAVRAFAAAIRAAVPDATRGTRS